MLGCWSWRQWQRSGACTGCRASRSRRSVVSSGFRERWSGRFCGPGRRNSATAGRGSRSPSWGRGRPSWSACWRRTRRGRGASG
ncbi:Transposase (plasmid) [Roseomonas mucosa]|nr:Transposase [Roseomonas mucosa]